MNHFCTYFDKNFLCQALALYHSLEENESNDFILWMLCLDDESFEIMRTINPVRGRVISVDEFITFDVRLSYARNDRSRMEFYYTCTPSLIKYVFSKNSDAEFVSYIDADMFFFHSSDEIFSENKDADIIIIEHRNPSFTEEDYQIRGKYNVCLIYFRKSEEAFQCLNWWSDSTFRCTKLGDGAWGDQKYLNEFQSKFDGVHVLKHLGVGAAPWNINNYIVKSTNNKIMINNERLIVYHFARLLMLHPFIFIPVRRNLLRREIIEIIYVPYMRTLRGAYLQIKKIKRDYRLGYSKHNLRGAFLGILMGRGFIQWNSRLIRIGFSWPIGYE